MPFTFKVTGMAPGSAAASGASSTVGAAGTAAAASTGEAVAAIPAAPRCDRKERRLMRVAAGCSALLPGGSCSVSSSDFLSVAKEDLRLKLGNDSPISYVRDPGPSGVERNRKRITIQVTLARSRSVDMYCTLQYTRRNRIANPFPTAACVYVFWRFDG